MICGGEKMFANSSLLILRMQLESIHITLLSLLISNSSAKNHLFNRELDVIPDLVMSGALQHIDHLHVDWTRWERTDSASSKMLLKVWHTLAATSIQDGIFLLRDDWTNITLVEQLSGAMSILSTIGKERGLLHTTEVAFPKYFTIYLFQNFLLVRSSL